MKHYKLFIQHEMQSTNPMKPHWKPMNIQWNPILTHKTLLDVINSGHEIHENPNLWGCWSFSTTGALEGAAWQPKNGTGGNDTGGENGKIWWV